MSKSWISDGVRRERPKIERYVVSYANRERTNDIGSIPSQQLMSRNHENVEGSLWWIHKHGGIKWPYTLLIGVRDE